MSSISRAQITVSMFNTISGLTAKDTVNFNYWYPTQAAIKGKDVIFSGESTTLNYDSGGKFIGYGNPDNVSRHIESDNSLTIKNAANMKFTAWDGWTYFSSPKGIKNTSVDFDEDFAQTNLLKANALIASARCYRKQD